MSGGDAYRYIQQNISISNIPHPAAGCRDALTIATAARGGSIG
jgi:hypothetical protein